MTNLDIAFIIFIIIVLIFSSGFAYLSINWMIKNNKVTSNMVVASILSLSVSLYGLYTLSEEIKEL